MTPEVGLGAIVTRFVVSFLVLAGLLFGSAGTWRWPGAWAYLVVQFSMSAAMTVWLARHNPGLLYERMMGLRRPSPRWDRALRAGLFTALAAEYVVPGLDAVRYHWTFVPLVMQSAGLLALVISLLIIYRAMQANPYLAPVVAVQTDRGHRVIDTGPYARVRHPMYLGVLVYVLALTLLLGSLWGLLPAAVAAGLVVVRARLEEGMLRRELAGYEEYAQRVRWRLVPGVW